MFQLRIAAPVIEQRGTRIGPHRFHTSNDDGVIAAIVELLATAFDHREHVVEHCIAARGAGEADTVESIYVDDRETSGNLLLARGKNVDDESGSRSECAMC